MMGKTGSKISISRIISLQWIFLVVVAAGMTGCRNTLATPIPETNTPAVEFSPTIEAATATAQLPSATPSPSPTITHTSPPLPTDTPLPSLTPTLTSLPPTPSGDEAIYIYLIQQDTDGLIKCGKTGDSVIKINTGNYRSGDVAADVATALRSLFVKRQWIAGLYNPAYLSNINVTSVDFKPFQGLISIRLAGTYVRSGDRCDDARVRAQVWSTIRQFPGIKTIDILLNGNLLGDILATR
jgi:hypothetical protein